MSGPDPLAALAAQAVANAQTAMDEAILSLGADVALLQAQVNVGDVIAALVLAPQGGADLLSFLGQTVVAQIPPGINPGETMLLQVTGFTNQAVIVRNLGTQDPDNPVTTVNVEMPPQEPGAPQSALLVTPIPANEPAPAQVPALQTSAAQQTPPAQQTPVAQTPARDASPPVAPPPSVFVAASVRSNLPPLRALAEESEEAGPSSVQSDVEARLALNRASAGPAPPPAAAPPAKNAAPPGQTSSTAPVPARTAAPAPAGRFPVAPPIVRPALAQNSAPLQTPAQAPSAPQAPAPRSTLPLSTEAALLTRLRIPVTPVTLAAARTIAAATQNVTAAYEKLEGLLAKLAPEEAGALRSMLAFVSRFDLRNTRALPEQIATFVSDVLDGAEAKLAQTVRMWNELTPQEVPPELPPAVPEEQAASQPPATAQTQTAAAQEQPATPQPVAVNVSAQAAERAAAMEYDVKTAILSMIENSPGGSPEITAALHEALTATTSLQLNVLASQASDPRTIAIPLPAYFYEGGAPVHLQISRDPPSGKNAMDGDNFHIAFILDTQSLGTVAIDLQTVGREVRVDVKTQATSAADRFRSTLGDLRERLEQLRYKVASIAAGVAPAAGSAQAPSGPSAPPDRKSFWDMRA
ncbi:MAG TPA: flagellar hook-length control protein FliK [Candidatus Acidoferrales bacterium]|nr:flagellar hook-length control protein FliK [Candidatus Acidoferrales bacterium]